ncbi:MAG: hypothetical protein R6U35_01745 [Candidatus Humimicrobiaceae bacterium]
MIKEPGIPVSTYNDRHTILVSPKKAKIPIEDQLEGKREPYTQFSAAMDELGINMIAAGSPQAKDYAPYCTPSLRLTFFNKLLPISLGSYKYSFLSVTL